MKKQILVIDDKPEISRIIKMFLGNEYSVISKNNGLDAFEWLRSGNMPDSIISDIQMPELDGFEFVKQLKISGSYNNIPIIMLSSIEESNQRIALYKLGVDDYMIKPFNPEELQVRLSNVLNRCKK